MSTGLDSELLADRTPLVVQGIQVIPSDSNRFKKTDNAAVYVEIYAPLLTGPNPPQVGVELVVVDRKTGEKKVDVAPGPTTQPGSADRSHGTEAASSFACSGFLSGRIASGGLRWKRRQASQRRLRSRVGRRGHCERGDTIVAGRVHAGAGFVARAVLTQTRP